MDEQGEVGAEVSAEGRAAGEQARAAAHRPGFAVSGPYGHPFHPMVASVAIGAWVAAVAFDVASRVVEGRAYARPAQWLVLIGVVVGVVAAVLGFLDSLRLTKGTRAHRLASIHLRLMVLTIVLFAISFVLRRADETDLLDGTPVGALVIAVIALVVMAAGGWMGGELAFRYGVRVADETDQLDGHRPTARVERSSKKDSPSE